MWWLAKLGKSWRRPRGKRNKVRLKRKAKVTQPTIGYGTPRAERNLHPSGLRELRVFALSELVSIDPKTQAVRIGNTVGTKKRLVLIAECEKKGIRVLNPGTRVESAKLKIKAEKKNMKEETKTEAKK